jgi:hypothetical protein
VSINGDCSLMGQVAGGSTRNNVMCVESMDVRCNSVGEVTMVHAKLTTDNFIVLFACVGSR